jgi:carboxylate-amine ligase
MGATPVADTDREPVDDPRFRAIADFYGPVAHDPAVCGCHVHVGVPSREQAILVCNHLRRWLPVVQALAVNSPLHNGRDTGYASWRATQLDRWPALGPTPAFSSAVAYDDAIDALVREGVMLDSTMVLWYARPSRNYPTVEVRVADVCLTADDAVLVAGLVRGLVATALDLVSAGIDPPEVPDHLIAAAHHFAARDGLDAALLDPSSGTEKPAWEVVESLVDLVSPALTRHGDIALIQHGLDRLRRDGTGAARQRAFLGPGGDFAALLDFVATQTTRP